MYKWEYVQHFLSALSLSCVNNITGKRRKNKPTTVYCVQFFLICIKCFVADVAALRLRDSYDERRVSTRRRNANEQLEKSGLEGKKMDDNGVSMTTKCSTEIMQQTKWKMKGKKYLHCVFGGQSRSQTKHLRKKLRFKSLSSLATIALHKKTNAW